MITAPPPFENESPEAKHPVPCNEQHVRAQAASAARPKPIRVTSRELLQGRAELIIVHDGREYRLRITQNGRLLLTA